MKVTDKALGALADQEYSKYMTATIEDRAIFSGIDGLKPVMRRSLWGAYELGLKSTAKRDKSAKVVGHALGNYHPHSDTAVYDALVMAASYVPKPLVDGEGNWGTMTSTHAAMRYTNMRLSSYADRIFFDPFYLPVMEYVSNYDGSRPEPLVFPALFPNALVNGNFGLMPAVNTRTPSFTLDSITKVLLRMLSGKKANWNKVCFDTLVFTTPFGGECLSPTEEIKAVMQDGVGQLTFGSNGVDLPDGGIRINRFAPVSDLPATLVKIASIPGVANVADDSDSSDPFKVAAIVQFGRNIKGDDRQDVIDQVLAELDVRQRMDIKVTTRVRKEGGKYGHVESTLHSVTVADILLDWVDFRIDLERRACSYWIEKALQEEALLRLLLLAIDHIDFILDTVKNRRLTDEQVRDKIARKLKITQEQSMTILKRNLLQLRKQEHSQLEAKLKDVTKRLASLNKRKSNPSGYIRASLPKLLKEIS